MSLRQIVPLAAVLFALLPASALAVPTVTVTGDDGNATPLNSATPVAVRQLESIPSTDTRYYSAQVIDAAGGGATPPSDCIDRRVSPSATGFPEYKVRGQIRERAARGKVTVSLAKGRRKGRFHRVGSAKISSKGRFTRRFRVSRTGTYRLRYTYKGSSLVAAGRATEVIKIRRRIFFG